MSINPDASINHSPVAKSESKFALKRGDPFPGRRFGSGIIALALSAGALGGISMARSQSPVEKVQEKLEKVEAADKQAKIERRKAEAEAREDFLKKSIKEERFITTETKPGEYTVAFEARDGDNIWTLTRDLNPLDPEALEEVFEAQLPNPDNPGYLPAGTPLELPSEIGDQVIHLQELMSRE